MSYVIYNKETTATAYQYKTYKTERSAKGALTKAIRNAKLIGPQDRWAVAESNDYHQNIMKMVKVRNLMSGEIVEQSINTPNYMSVGSEAYWSM